MARFRSALLALAVTASCAAAAFGGVSGAAQAQTSKAPVIKIIAFGSSSTEGIGASKPSATYPAQLQTLLRKAGQQVTVVNRGIGGEDADDMIARLKRDVLDRHPDLVIFQTGSNDPMRKVPLARFEAETRETIARMQSAGIAVMLMEPQWCPTLGKYAAANAYRDVVRKIGAELGLPVIRRFDLMQAWVAKGILTQDQMLYKDHLHMSDKGYALLAKFVAIEVMKQKAFHPATVEASVAKSAI